MTPHHREVAPALSDTPDYSGFLFAQVWTEPSGMTLSVVSALARLNLDPSREAVRLATMPRAAAAIILSKAIANLPNPPPAVDVSGTAARLIKLLPDLSATVRLAAAASAPRAWRQWRMILSRRWQLWLILVLAGCVVYLWIASGSVDWEAAESVGVPAAGLQTMPLADSGGIAPQANRPATPRQ
ncbi:MAG TPA: hypothetical protein VGB82_07000 [Alphaproteobacteria bacterium]